MSTPISTVEYLKKYMSKTEKHRKPKTVNKKRNTNRGFRIVDDNYADSFTYSIGEEEDEDAPQVVAVIDNRPPPSVENDMWRPVGETNVASTAITKDVQQISRLGADLAQDNSPPRKVTYADSEQDADMSPVRRKALCKRQKQHDNEYTPPREDCADKSPLRRKTYENDIQDKDVLSLRYKNRDKINERRSKDVSSSRRNRTDYSPPRRKRLDVDDDLCRNSSSLRNNCMRKSRDTHSEDLSPPRRKYTGSSPSRRQKTVDDVRDLSPERIRNVHTHKQQHRKDLTPPRTKRTGLQNREKITQEATDLHKREQELFNSLPDDISGKNAATVVRSRKHRNKDADDEEAQKREKDEQRKNAQYSRWGKGVTQIENEEQRMQNDLHEMSKPLSRYVDDEDLERHLKEQERAGDPMLDYIRKKRRKTAVEQNVHVKPEYVGSFMPNRYGIRPGYRWDGVDRSTGYEKRWLEQKNAKEAQKQESYKWSTEDM